DSDVLCGVLKELGVELGRVGNPLSIGRPCGLTVVAWIGGHLGQTGALVLIVGGDHPYVGVVGAIGIRRGAVAREGDARAIRRPGRFIIIKIAGGDLRRRFRRDVENVKMPATPVEIADGVALELHTVHDPGLLRLGLLVFGGVVGFVLVL